MSESPIPRESEVRDRSPVDERPSRPVNDSPARDERRGRSRSSTSRNGADRRRGGSPQDRGDRRERDRSDRDGADNKNIVYVAKLSRNTREADLKDGFSRFGVIKSIALKQSFAFITYDNPESAAEAITRMNGSKFLNGEEILVEASGTQSSSLLKTFM